MIGKRENVTVFPFLIHNNTVCKDLQSIFKKLLVILNVAGVDPGVVGYDLGGIEGFALEQFNSSLDGRLQPNSRRPVLRNRNR